MNPVALFFGLVLLAVSVFFIASPFRSSVLQKQSVERSGATKNNGAQKDGAPQKDSLKISPEVQRQAVLLALRDLDFDYQAGKVAEEDYQALRANLLTDAARLMDVQERQKEDSIEALIQARRHGKPAVQNKVNGSSQKLCQHCQAVLLPGAKFCSKCGKEVEEITCPKCKQTLQTGDQFCPSCGTAIIQEKQSKETAA